MVVTTGVSTSALYVSGRKSKPLWMMSKSPACSKAEAMWSASATFGSIVSSSFHPCGEVLRRTAVGDRVGGGEQRHVVSGRDQPVGEQGGEELPRAVVAGRRAPGDGREDSDPQG